MVGFDGILLIAIVALLLSGPDGLPQYLRELGRPNAELKKAQSELSGSFPGTPWHPRLPQGSCLRR